MQEPIRLIHVGYADQRRRLEDTIEAVRSLGDGFVLDLVLARDNEYRRRMEQMVAGDPQCRVLPPLPTAEVIPFANAYDIGVFLLPARFPNQVHVLPNKLFDYIQARLAVAIGPSPEMAAVVAEWDCGVVSTDFTPESFAAGAADPHGCRGAAPEGQRRPSGQGAQRRAQPRHGSPAGSARQPGRDLEPVRRPMSRERGRVVILAYYFPPLAGIASERAFSLSHHLRDLGWDVVVVTARDGFYHRSPEAAEASVEVVKTRSIEISRLVRQAYSAGPHLGRR